MNDFCYLCFQREKRNVPIYYTEERKKEDQEEDHLLQMYTMLKDSEANKKEEVHYLYDFKLFFLRSFSLSKYWLFHSITI